jgi:hypothetical protein
MRIHQSSLRWITPIERKNMPITHQTALITGPTSGIGEEIARQMAARGYHLILVSRSAGKLASLCKSLSKNHGVKTQYIQADLSQPEAPETIFQEVNARGLQVDILVNNAGVQVYAPFARADWDALQSQMRINCSALAHLTHLFLPGMLAQNAGRILNIGSTASFAPGPNNAIYGASKAFVLSLSEAIAEELKDSAVTVTCLCPGATDTPFADKADLRETPLFRYMVMRAEKVAAQGIRAMERGKRVHVTGWINKFLVFAIPLVPRRWTTKMAKWFLKRPE